MAAARTTAAQGFSGRSRIWSRCGRATRRRWRRCWARRPTRVAAENFGAARRGGGRAEGLRRRPGGASCSGDWPARRAAPAGPLPDGRGVGGGPGGRRTAAAGRADARCWPGSRWSRDLAAALELVAAQPQLRAVTRRRRPRRRRLGQRRLRPQAEHAGDHLRGGEGPRRTGRCRDGRPASCRPRWPARWPSRRPVRTPPSRRWPRSTSPTPRSRRSTSSWAGSARTPAPPTTNGSG